MAREGDQTVMIGVVSYGLKCGYFPSIYQAVGPLIDWIKNVVGETLPAPD